MATKPKHLYERIVNRLAGRIETLSDEMADALSAGGSQPPFTVKLTEMEQLEQYYAMDEAKWQSVIQQYGLKEAVDYSEAMQKLHSKYIGPVQPTIAPLLPETVPQMGGGQNPNIDAQAQQIVQDVLRGSGL